ncbi:MAG TPA: hypothetical protein VEU27_06435 [Gemmatimonadales bacterium]|nr:hypothetical protein [Gemmatimonadales bacterium]
MRSPLTAGLAGCLLAGCYTYRLLPSVDPAMPAAGTQVKVRLTTAGAAALANQVGSDVLFLGGTLVSADSNGLTLKMARSETARHVSQDWKGEHLTLPKEDVGSVGERKLSVGATALIGGLAGGSMVAVVALFGGSGTASGLASPSTSGHQ